MWNNFRGIPTVLAEDLTETNFKRGHQKYLVIHFLGKYPFVYFQEL